MNRPFYWRYIESVNETPAPAELTFFTDVGQMKNGVRGEAIHFGSPRLHQLFKVAQEKGAYVNVYEVAEPGGQTVLTPWLAMNYKISYRCHQTKERFVSLGMNLMNGAVYQEFQESIKDVELGTELHGAFPLPSIISPGRAVDKLDETVDWLIRQDDHSWVEEAQARQKKEMAVLEFFYEGKTEKPECYEVEKQAIEERFSPRVTVEVVNGGLFYLRSGEQVLAGSGR